MTSRQPIFVHHLDNGLQLEFYDQSNRYFGDYHRVKLLVRCEVPLREDCFAGQPNPRRACERARRLLGETVVFEKTLERMGVSGAEVESVRDRLIHGFLSSSAAYLQHPGFPTRLVASRLKERQRRPPLVPMH